MYWAKLLTCLCIVVLLMCTLFVQHEVEAKPSCGFRARWKTRRCVQRQVRNHILIFIYSWFEIQGFFKFK